MKRDLRINRRQFVTIASGLWASTLIPNINEGGKTRHGKGVPTEELTCIAKIKSVHVAYELSDGSMEVHVECLGIDGCGEKFNLKLHFHPSTSPIRGDKIVQDLNVDGIFWLRGEWAFRDANKSMIMFDPTYRRYEPIDPREDLSVAKMNELFFEDDRPICKYS